MVDDCKVCFAYWLAAGAKLPQRSPAKNKGGQGGQGGPTGPPPPPPPPPHHSAHRKPMRCTRLGRPSSVSNMRATHPV
jgi:hypothetical protein